MFIHLDKNKLHLQAIVGILEEYHPSEEIKAIQDKLNELRSQVEEFQKQVVFPALECIEKKVNEENNKFVSQAQEVKAE